MKPFLIAELDYLTRVKLLGVEGILGVTWNKPDSLKSDFNQLQGVCFMFNYPKMSETKNKILTIIDNI